MDASKTDEGRSAAAQRGSARWLRALIVYLIVFLAGAAVMFFAVRHFWNFYNLYQGGQDRSLLAIDAAHLNGEQLEVSFIRSAPDQPAGAFVLSGHKPAHNTSDPGKENHLNADSVTFDGTEYEILFEATEPGRFAGRSALIPFAIEWVDRERGRLTLGPVNQRALNHITSFRAFLLLVKDDGEFYTANISFD